MISRAKLRAIVHYDPTTGRFTALINRRSLKIGERVGAPNKRGYWRVFLFGRNYYLHRLAIFYMTGDWPAIQTDHRDGDPSNNRWLNIRPADQFQNGSNRKVGCNSSTGVVGVLRLPNGTYRAHIATKKHRVVATFEEFEEAVIARHFMALQFFGEFARGT